MSPNWAWSEEVKVAVGEVSDLITNEMRMSRDETIKPKVDKILDKISQMLNYADAILKYNIEDQVRFSMFGFKEIMAKAAKAKAEAEKLAASLQPSSSSLTAE
jgi:hypothetical protein